MNQSHKHTQIRIVFGCFSADQQKHTPPLGHGVFSLSGFYSGQRVTTVLNRVDLGPESIQHADLSAVNKLYLTTGLYCEATSTYICSLAGFTNDPLGPQ